ncbi:MAG: FAD-dependent oxidoreductase [Candidatus Moraniibacteriota bacterium]|nr:MAG: FAD-dependent oxidoreductase [Candidatus Moranbacteria bacterium]
MFDVVVIGGGPAGVAAGIYSARKQMNTLFLSESIGGQSSVSATIENWIGDISLKGFEFAQKLESHLRAQESIDIRLMTRVEKIKSFSKGFLVTTQKGDVFETLSVIIATGGSHRHLNVPGEEKFIGKGVVFCSTCDAPFFRNKTVAVVGAGNSGLEACQDLFPYAKEIFLLSNTDHLGGDVVNQDVVIGNNKVTLVYNSVTKEILGDTVVTGIRYEDTVTNEDKILDVDGVFVEIGMVPNSLFVKDMLEVNSYGEIVIDHRTMATSVEGIFAAGDVTDIIYRQNNIGAGQGSIAALSAYDWTKKKQR